MWTLMLEPYSQPCCENKHTNTWGKTDFDNRECLSPKKWATSDCTVHIAVYKGTVHVTLYM